MSKALGVTGGINFVRYLFYKDHYFSPAEKQGLIALAYATARDNMLAPQEILIRSGLHKTTFENGKLVSDEWHGTFSFKDRQQVLRNYHGTAHGYTDGKDNYTLKRAKSTPEKPDDTPRGSKGSGKVVWPSDNRLEEFAVSPIGHSHLPEAPEGN